MALCSFFPPCAIIVLSPSLLVCLMTKIYVVMAYLFLNQYYKRFEIVKRLFAVRD